MDFIWVLPCIVIGLGLWKMLEIIFYLFGEGKEMVDQDRANREITKELESELAETNAHRLSLVENRVKQLDASIDHMNKIMLQVAETDRQTQEICQMFLKELESAK